MTGATQRGTEIGSDPIARIIDDEAGATVPPQITAAARVVCAALGDAVDAVLFYGSALRDGDLEGKVIDLYALVDRYRPAYGKVVPAVANRILPPNVYYLSTDGGARAVRIKYAVTSFAQFERQAAGRACTPYIWARFAQPTAIVYARDTKCRERVVTALRQATFTLLRNAGPLMSAEFSSNDFWPRVLRESYRTELRAEPGSKANELYHSNRNRYDAIVEAASDLHLGYGRGGEEGRYLRTAAWPRVLPPRAAWLARRPVGKFLSLARLVKAAFTFNQGVDYILWKVERHSGVKVTATDWQRRHPLMAATVLAWRLYVRRGFR